MSKITAIVLCLLSVVGLLAWIDIRGDLRDMKWERERAVQRVIESNASKQSGVEARLDRIEATLERFTGRTEDGDK